MSDASVRLWGREIGAVSWDDERGLGVFEYAPEFATKSGIEVAPLRMPLKANISYEFPELAGQAFHGLPGLVADSLPDKFGNAVINAWLASQGRPEGSMNPVERLLYIGTRGMGALEYHPPRMAQQQGRGRDVEIEALVELANRVLNDRNNLQGRFRGDDDREEIEEILRVGTSAGGARAKAILAWNPHSNEFRSGQVDVDAGFQHWIMKFDGVANNKDRETVADPQGYGKIEYAYYLMAQQAGIIMMESRLHHEGGRSHFMTRRFDRTPQGGKLHMQSLAALMHLDYNMAGAHSYEQALQAIRALKLSSSDMEQQFLRTVFNVVARNQDDHVKNIAFLMDQAGQWRLSPAFDVIYAWNPDGSWTNRHQMAINGKRDSFQRSDLEQLAQVGNIKKRRADILIDQVIAAVRDWEHFASQAGVSKDQVAAIQTAHRTNL
ncbi:MAG: type II toxin-antitoxin system HipA family toxin [Pseudomonadota bacterium]